MPIALLTSLEWHDLPVAALAITERGSGMASRPPKSSCYFCGSIKPNEVLELSTEELRIIVLMEARAKLRLRNVEGLWRKPVLGRRGATPRPGTITEFIRERGLLSPAEVDCIIEEALMALLDFQAAQAVLPAEQRARMGRWLDDFHRSADALAAG